MRHVAAIAVLCVGPLFAAPVPKSVKSAALPLDGTWRVETIFNGSTHGRTGKQTWDIKDGQARVSFDGREGDYPLELTRPDGGGANAVNYRVGPADLDGKGKDVSTFPCVFERDGDTFRLCISTSSERPTDYTPGEGRTVLLFKRVSEDTKTEQKAK